MEAAKWPLMKHPELNLPCAARWHVDKNWYRAQIVGLTNVSSQEKVAVSSKLSDRLFGQDEISRSFGSRRNPFIQVHFVDWGNSDEIRLAELRYMPLEGLRPRRRSTKGCANSFPFILPMK